MKEVTDYISQLKFKRTIFGGYDREDVYAKIGEIVNKFEDCLKKYEAKEKALIEDYENQVKAADALAAELNKKVGVLAEEQQMYIKENQQMKKVYHEYCSELLHQYSSSLCALSNEFSKVMENVMNLQKEITDEKILDNFEKYIEKQIKEEKADEL